MRNYKQEYKNYQGKPDQIKRRAGRNKARALMMAKGLARKGDGKDVDHRNRNPNDNSASNLRIQSKSKNRARNQ